MSTNYFRQFFDSKSLNLHSLRILALISVKKNLEEYDQNIISDQKESEKITAQKSILNKIDDEFVHMLCENAIQ